MRIKTIKNEIKFQKSIIIKSIEKPSMQSRPQIIRQFQWIFRFIFDFCWLSCQHVQLSNSTTIKDVISSEYNTHDFSLLHQILRPLTKRLNSLTSMASVLYTHAKKSSIYIVSDKSFFFSKQSLGFL